MSFVGIVFLFLQVFFENWLTKWGLTLQKTPLDIEEELPNFFNAIKLYHADQVVCEFENLRDNYMIEIQRPEFVEKLQQMSVPKVAISTGTPWYSILSNPYYADAFCYIGAEISDRNKYIKDQDDDEENDCEQSDIIMVLLNLGAVPDEVAQKFDFAPGF